MRERDIEKWFRQQVEALGGIAFKFMSPGNDGVPDRILVLPGGRIYFVELKADQGRVKPIQEWQQGRLARLGCRVQTVRGIEEARAFIEKMKREVMESEVRAPRLPEAGD